MTSPRTLIIVDVQYDFCPGGALATQRGNEVASKIGSIQDEYDLVVATQDWHIDPGTHFSAEPDFLNSWPVHCVAGTHGADVHDAIAPVQAYFHKGEYEAAYSGFEGFTEAESAQGDFTHSVQTSTETSPEHPCRIPLHTWLQDRGVEQVDIVGIATDHCVRATAADALRAGFSVRVLKDYCAPVDEERGAYALHQLAEAGAVIV